ncbi:MAG: hypothetical protein L0I76_31250, partial [Pseudonocardia sp.]|nr:hypothetical protein [Pseudonocardia sp.]
MNTARPAIHTSQLGTSGFDGRRAAGWVTGRAAVSRRVGCGASSICREDVVAPPLRARSQSCGAGLWSGSVLTP